MQQSMDRSPAPKLKRWLKARYTMDEDDTPGAVQKVSDELAADMAAQGASEPWQLGAIELGIALCRTFSKEECKNYVHRTSWKSWCPKTVWQRKDEDFDALLDVCMASGAVGPVDEWMSNYTGQLMEQGDAFSRAAAAHIMTTWQAIRQKLKAPAAILYYVHALRRLKRGRGFPDRDPLVDPTIVSDTNSAAYAGELSSGRGLASLTRSPLVGAKGPPSTVSGVSTLSSASEGGSEIGPSASVVGTAEISAISVQLSEIVGSLGEFRSSLAEVKQGLSTVKGQVRKLEQNADKPSGEGLQCFHCKKAGHYSTDCPDATEKERAEYREKFNRKK